MRCGTSEVIRESTPSGAFSASGASGASSAIWLELAGPSRPCFTWWTSENARSWPSTSGTRDAFEELVIEQGVEHIDGYNGEKPSIRQDGKFVPSGENDNLIVQKLAQNANAVGIFGYSFLEENRNKIQAAKVDGVEPKRELISSGEYPISRSLFFYTKNAHVGRIDGMEQYVDLFLSDQMASDRGALKSLGLISLPPEELEGMREKWKNRDKVTAESLKSEHG